MLDKLSLIIDYSRSLGIENTDVMFLNISERRVSSRNNRIENVEEITNGCYFVRLLQDKRLISLSFNLFDDYKKIISSSINLTKYMLPDNCADFFNMVENCNVKSYQRGEFTDFDELISDANKISGLSMQGKNIINLEACVVSSKRIEKYIACTNGFKLKDDNSLNSYYLNLIAKDPGTNKLEQDYNFLISPNRNTDINFFVDKCVLRCNRKLNSRKLKSGKYNVVIEKRAAREFIQHFCDAINGELVSKESSFLCGLQGKQVFNRDINIYDDPLYHDGVFFRNFDDEGRVLSKLSIIEKGVLKNYLLDTYNANKLNLKSNRGFNKAGIMTSEYTNLFIESDNVENLEKICSRYSNVILVTDFIGMGVNLSNGNYSRGISGNIIINGEISGAVSEITMSGNLLEMYKSIVLLDDADYENGISIPSIYVGELMISGE